MEIWKSRENYLAFDLKHKRFNLVRQDLWMASNRITGACSIALAIQTLASRLAFSRGIQLKPFGISGIL